MARYEEALLRRMGLARAGFSYCAQQGLWHRGRRLQLSDEAVDALEPWPAYLRRWMATRPRRQERSTMRHHMERWRAALARYEQYDAPLHLQALDAKAGTFKGYASVFNSPVQSWIPTVILPGAFTKTLQEHPPSAVKILWMHDLENPIGACLALQETTIGLEIVGKVSLTTITQHYLTLIRDGVVDALSIGFDPMRWTLEDRGPDLAPLRKIHEVRLWEISCVTLGADPAAKITDVNRRPGSRTTAERLALLQAAEGTLAPGWPRRSPALTAERLDQLIMDAKDALWRACAIPEVRPSPPREYAEYVRTAAAAGRPVLLPDGSLLPSSVEEMAYLAPLAAAVRAQQQAATQQRLQRLEEAERQDWLSSTRRR